MKVICVVETNVGKNKKESTQKLFDELTEFYNTYYTHYKRNDKLTYTHLNTVLDYEAISIFTCISNHINEHFENIFYQYINALIDKRGNEKTISREFKKKIEEAKLIYTTNKKKIDEVKSMYVNDKKKLEEIKLMYTNEKKKMRNEIKLLNIICQKNLRIYRKKVNAFKKFLFTTKIETNANIQTKLDTFREKVISLKEEMNKHLQTKEILKNFTKKTIDRMVLGEKNRI